MYYVFVPSDLTKFEVFISQKHAKRIKNERNNIADTKWKTSPLYLLTNVMYEEKMEPSFHDLSMAILHSFSHNFITFRTFTFYTANERGEGRLHKFPAQDACSGANRYH